MEINRLKWLYWTGFFLILALPLLNSQPWFSPPDWGKTIVFRVVLSILIFIFLWQLLSQKRNNTFSTAVRNVLCRKSKVFWGFLLLVALLGIFFLATAFSLDRNFSLWGSPYRSGGFVNFAFYIIFAILAFLILQKEDWQKIWDFSILIGIFVSIIAILQQFGLISKIFIPYENRPPSTIGNPIFLAIYLLLLTFLTLSFGIKEKKRVKKSLYFLSFLFFLFVIVFITATRAAIIGLAAGFLYFIFFFPFKKRSISLAVKIIIFISLLFGIYGFYYINTQPLPQFVQKNKLLSGVIPRFLIKDIISDARVSAWKISWQALKEKPILGYGPENFSIGFDKFYDPSLPNIEKMPGTFTSWWDRAHNFIFDISITTGIPALVIYLSLFGVLFFQLQKLKTTNLHEYKDESIRIHESTSIVAQGIQATFLAYLVANFFSFDSFSTYLISFLLIGYALALIRDNASQSEEETRPTTRKEKQKYNEHNLWKSVFLFVSFCVLVWFIWNFNVKPLEINKEIKIARSQSNNEDFKGALTKMENLLKKRSFLDSYLRLNYIEIISQAIGKGTERTQIALAQKARTILNENTKIQPYYTRNWILLGNYTNFLIEKGQKELKNEAIYYFEKAKELSPKRQEVSIGLIKTALLTNDYQGAKERAKECIDLNPKLGECWWLMGLINIHLTESEEAQENIKIAGQEGYPIYSESSFLQLVKVYTETKNYQKLIEVYQELIKIDSKPSYHASIATAYKEIGDFENAKKEALKVLELNPASRQEIEKFLQTLP